MARSQAAGGDERRRGEQVLVDGGAGGVGAYAVQLASAHGAHVTASASAKDLEHVWSLGAARVIDFQNESFDDRSEVFDICRILATNPRQTLSLAGRGGGYRCR